MLGVISGSQGSGKSTIIAALKANGYETIARQTSRSILTDWNVTLDEVNHDLDLTIKFQDEITKRKWNDELEATISDTMVFTERSHMDLFTYALITLGKHNKYSDWLNRYYKRCVTYSQAAKHVFFLQTGCFVVESDGVRGDNKHYSDMVNDLMLKHTSNVVANKITIVTECTIEDRMEAILHNQ